MSHIGKTQQVLLPYSSISTILFASSLIVCLDLNNFWQFSSEYLHSVTFFFCHSQTKLITTLTLFSNFLFFKKELQLFLNQHCATSSSVSKIFIFLTKVAAYQNIVIMSHILVHLCCVCYTPCGAMWCHGLVFLLIIFTFYYFIIIIFILFQTQENTTLIA